MLAVLGVKRLTKIVLAMAILLANQLSHGAENDRVDLKIDTPRGSANINLDTQNVDAKTQVSGDGLVFITPEAANKVVLQKSQELMPIKKEGETIGFFTKARFIKHFEKWEKLYMTTFGVTITGASFYTGKSVVAGHLLWGDEVSFDKLAAVPTTMALSFLFRFFYNDFVTFFNYEGYGKKFLENRKLAKEFLETGVRSEKLKDAGNAEQLAKMYLFELVFMGAASLGTQDPSVAVGVGMLEATLTFFVTSIAYTLSTTYDLIIMKKRDLLIAQNPTRGLGLRTKAGLTSMALAFIDNVGMTTALSGSEIGLALVGLGAIAFNVYHFGNYGYAKPVCGALFN